MDNICKCCKSTDVKIIWDDYIRFGSFGTHTTEKYKMYQCQNCGLIWHRNDKFNSRYYESIQYRSETDGISSVQEYYSVDDLQNLSRLSITGMDIFRNQVVTDIGCAVGSFLDLLHGIAKETIGIEPNEMFREDMQKRGHITFPYTSNALADMGRGCIDVIVSFDCIEHVDDLNGFMHDCWELLKKGGRAIISTPTDYPLLKKYCGHDWEQFCYRYQHPWILSKKSMEMLAQTAGFQEIKVVYKQRYGLSNAVMWMDKKRPMGDGLLEFITEEMDIAFKRRVEAKGLSDYIVAYLRK